MADGTYTPDERMYSAIGRYTVSWAIVEVALDHLVFCSYIWAGGQQIEEEMPWSLERKVKFLRKSFRRLSALQPFEAEAETILTEVKKIADKRHDIIHGVATEHPEGVTEIKMLRLLRSKTDRAIKVYKVTYSGILAAATEANQLGGQALKLCQRVVDAVNPSE